ncbi:MAG: 3-deoxy-D-manno-octulosonic acid transferase [Bacteroidales bacterium]
MYKTLYNCSIAIYGVCVALFAIFSTKARAWYCGRRVLFENLEKALQKKNNRSVAWFHCASLGEFEQGRPVLEAFRKMHPNYFIVLTFFSPSGYKFCRDYKHADYVCYMPLDLPYLAKRFVRLLSPKIAFFIKYEFWYNHLWELKKNGVKVYLISAIFREQQRFFRGFLAPFFGQILHFYEHIFVQTQASVQLLQKKGITSVTCSGDTRFDRVLENAKTPKEIESLIEFSQRSTLLVAGSTWAEDERLLAALYEKQPKLKMLIVPHEVSIGGTQRILKMFSGRVIAYSALQGDSSLSASDYDIIVLDAIGILSSSYKMAHITYVGGGFGVGIHNTLEAAVYGKPVIFGPNYSKFREAIDLLEQGAAFSVKKLEELEHTVHHLCTDANYYTQCASLAKEYVEKNAGATAIIMEKLRTSPI